MYLTMLEAPLLQMADNTGVDASSIVRYIQDTDGNVGYDFTKYKPGDWEAGKVLDMMAAGIVDPLKVTRLALENAVSIASTLITTEAVVVDKPEKKEPMGGGGMGGMGGM